MKNIKITLNGVKVDGNYIPCFFSIDNYSNCVWVYARDYGRGLLPEELGKITNDTDSQTDYFETDHVAVTADNKYFKACYKSAINSSIKNYKAKIRNCERQHKKNGPGLKRQRPGPRKLRSRNRDYYTHRISGCQYKGENHGRYKRNDRKKIFRPRRLSRRRKKKNRKA